MATLWDENNLAITALVTVCYQLGFFLLTWALKVDTFTDLAGGTNFAVLALLGLILTSTYTARQVVLTTLVVLWAVRLSGFLFYRILVWREDRRFDDKRKDLGQLAVFWLLQMVWVWVTSLPLTVANASEADVPLCALDYAGWACWAVGFATEATADLQKMKFKSNEANQGMWCDAGVWAISRHPNYFGEILLWWGVYLSALPLLSGATYAAVCGPVLVMTLLLFISGIPLLEKGADGKHGTKPEYLEYKASTSPLIPLPCSLWRPLPLPIKWLLFEYPMYTSTGCSDRNSVASNEAPLSNEQ